MSHLNAARSRHLLFISVIKFEVQQSAVCLLEIIVKLRVAFLQGLQITLDTTRQYFARALSLGSRLVATPPGPQSASTSDKGRRGPLAWKDAVLDSLTFPRFPAVLFDARLSVKQTKNSRLTFLTIF